MSEGLAAVIAHVNCPAGVMKSLVVSEQVTVGKSLGAAREFALVR